MRSARLVGGIGCGDVIADHFVNEFGGQKVRTFLPWHGAKFYYIHTNDGGASIDFLQQIEHLVPVETAGFGRADRGHLRGVNSVEIEGDIGVRAETFPGDTGAAVSELMRPDDGNSGLSCVVGECGHRFQKSGLFGTKAANTDFEQRNAHSDDSAFDRGVRQGRALKGITHIAMGVDMHHGEIGVAFMYGGDDRRRQRVLTTKGEGKLALIERMTGGGSGGL